MNMQMLTLVSATTLPRWCVLASALFVSAALAEPVGTTSLKLPGSKWSVTIDDISPDRGSEGQDAANQYGTPWGLSLAIARSGKELVASPATGWRTPNGPVQVDHVATVDAAGRLITFYWSPPSTDLSDDTSAAGWKSVDISGKTGDRLRVEQPTSWTRKVGSTLYENVAGRDQNDRLRLFTWAPGQDWASQPVSPAAGPMFTGPISGWLSDTGAQVSESIGARSSLGKLMVYRRMGGSGSWNSSEATSSSVPTVTGHPTGWHDSDSGTDRLATHDAAQHLWLFVRGASKTATWTARDLTQATGGTLAHGPVAAWDVNGRQHIAARSPTGHLLVFVEDPLESRWSVTDVTDETKTSIAVAPNHWSTSAFGNAYNKLVAPDANGVIHVFSEGERSAGWSVENVTKHSGVRSPHRLAAWSTPSPNWGMIDHLAAPTAANLLHVFSFRTGGDWETVDVSTRSSGGVVFAATPWAGVFGSQDYGVTWKQSSRPQPAPGDMAVPGALPVPTVLDVVVSPQNPDLVLVATAREGRRDQDARANSEAGIYRSTDGGDSWALVYTFTCGGMNRAVTQIEYAPDDPERVYAAGHCGIARSTDGGKYWTLLSPPDTPAGTPVGNHAVNHIAVGSKQARRRVLVACGPQNVWMSRDDGKHWLNDTNSDAWPDSFCGNTEFNYKNDSGAEVLALDPGDPNKFYYAHHSWANGPSFLHPTEAGLEGVACNIPVLYDADGDRLAGPGEDYIRLNRQRPTSTAQFVAAPLLRFVDLNANGTWDDPEPVYFDVNDDQHIDKNEQRLNGDEQSVGTALVRDPHILYLPGGYGGYDAGYGPRSCGEGSLWLVDYDKSNATHPAGNWTQLPGPPVYQILWGSGSGHTLVRTVATSRGHLVFFTDGDTLHVAEGAPAASGWYRLDGTSMAETHHLGAKRPNISVHADPRGLAVSEGYDVELARSDLPPPRGLMSELKQCIGGRVWLSTDGGVYSNETCGQIDRHTDRKLWQQTESGLNILWSLNVAGATGSRLTASIPRAFYTGTTHDDDFVTVDGGKSWKSPAGACGDCDVWLGDLYQRRRILQINPRGDNQKGVLSVFEATTNVPPDANQVKLRTEYNYPVGARSLTLSSNVIRGSRHVIQSMPGTTPPADGDYLLIVGRSGSRRLLRAHDSVDTAAADRGFVQVGPVLPANVMVVQASGGHVDPTYFVGNGTSIWRLDRNAAGQLYWNQIVVAGARRFFVDPWRDHILYLISTNNVQQSTDGGDHWLVDHALTDAISDQGAWRFRCQDTFCLLNDMAFDPTNATRRFAAGLAGVFYTAGGREWTRLLATRALPSRPLSLWFDPLTDPGSDTLVVAAIGRGILRLSPIPDTDPVKPLIWRKPPGSGLIDPHRWTPVGTWSKLNWKPAGAATLRRPSDMETATLGRRPILMLGDGRVDASAHLDVELACHSAEQRLSFLWQATHDRGREVPDAVDVWFTAEGRAPELVTTLGAELSNGTWQQETIAFLPARCGSVSLEFRSRFAGTRSSRFQIGAVNLERVTGASPQD